MTARFDPAGARVKRSPDVGEYAHVLESAPMYVVRPGTPKECAAILKEAGEQGRSVLAFGAGRHQRAYGVPTSDVVLETGGLSGIVEHDAGDQTITVRAGTPIAEIHQAARDSGQWLPLDPTGSDDATIGGVISAGVSGPLRTGFGPVRDHLLGTEAAYSDGEVARSGGRLVKNVTGFDIHRLQHGAYGTLGVLTEVHLRLRPRPAVDRTLIARVDLEGLDRFHAAWRATGASAAAISALSTTSSEPGRVGEAFLLQMRLVGSLRAVAVNDALARTLITEEVQVIEGDASVKSWRELTGAWVPQDGGVAIRVSALPMVGPRSRLGEVCAAIEEEVVGLSVPAPGLAIEPMSGVIRVVFSSAPPASIVSCLFARPEVADVAVEDAAPAFRRDANPMPAGLQVPALQARLHRALDPSGVLSPGRFPFPAVTP